MPRQQLNIPQRRVVTQIVEDGKVTGHASRWAEEGDRLRDGEHWEESPILHLGWSPTTDLGLEGAIVYIDVDADEVLRAAEEVKRNREVFGNGATSYHQFHTVVLKRSEMQEIIKTVRRARDAVFEPDA
jgi:hypothetical protein